MEFKEESSIVDLREDAKVKFQALVDRKWTLVGELSIYQVGDGSWHIHGRLPEEMAADIQQYVTDAGGRWGRRVGSKPDNPNEDSEVGNLDDLPIVPPSERQ